MARKAKSRWRMRLFATVWLLALAGGLWGWWTLRYWTPPRAEYPVQGVEIGSADGAVDFRALKAVGAQFVYIDASASAFARDAMFSRNLEEARAAKLQVGALHRYDPCQPADRQAANFVTVVPRDGALLPPAVELDLLADDCPVKVSDASVESELTTFLNEVETHTGKPVILKLTPQFHKRYRTATRIERNLWLVRTWFPPDYAGRPWSLWTANRALATEASEVTVQWVVVQR